jgi:hypothetical protein
MGSYVVTSPFTSESGAHKIGDVLTGAGDIASVLEGDDAAFVVHGADPSPTVAVLLITGQI